MFVGLDSKRLREKYFEKYFGYIKHQLLQMPEVQEDLNSFKKTEFEIADIKDVSYFQKPYLQTHCDALLFCLYHDDFEIVNPIGSHRKKHKLSVFYLTLLNIKVESCFKLQATQLLAIAKSADIKKIGLENLLHDFVGSLL